MKFSLLLFCFGFGVQLATAQSPAIIQRDPAIAEMVTQVNPDSLKSYIISMVSFGTRHTVSTQADSKKGIGAAKLWVLSKFNQFAAASGGRLTAMIDSTTYKADKRRVDVDINLGNVVATLKGTDPADKRIFLVTGHLDSRVTNIANKTSDAPGANDDASGCAAVLECARIMSKSSFPATVIFMTVSGEEQGLLGAGYMAKKAKELGLDIEAVLNNDIMGSNNSNETNVINNTQVRVFSEGLPAYRIDSVSRNIRFMGLENDGAPRQLARYFKETTERYVDHLEVKLIYRNDRFGRGGDHSPFVENGFTAVRMTEMNENFDHQHQDLRTEKGIQYGDLVEFMDFEYLRKNTAANLVTLANLAKAPAMPQEVVYIMSGLGNKTTLRWNKPATGKVAGYFILIRESSNATWQKKYFTTDTTMTLPYTKDNYLFAVQSVSADGNESLPVVPMLARRAPAAAAQR